MVQWQTAPQWMGVLAGVLGLVACGQSTTGEAAPVGGVETAALSVANPILFVTQVPIPSDFTNVVSTFGNHLGNPGSAPRGGDLYIRYPNERLKNLTKTAGFGSDGLQGANSIAVREPCVHWNGQKAIFSMVVGSPNQYQNSAYRWQLYEITGLGETEEPVITKVPNQPAQYNNVSPIYASDGRILFTSDRPHNGQAHLFPQRDEYEEQPTNTGIWSLNPQSGDLFLMNHSPSGSFSPRIDSFGRIVFTRWDHLERDQQADDDHIGGNIYGTFNYSEEGPNGVPTNSNDEVFPEPRDHWINYVNDHPNYSGPLHGYQPNLVGNNINHFFPWTLNQDGTEEETLNHIGRHELHSYFVAARNDDPNLISFLGPTPHTSNHRPITNLFQIREDPNSPGTYWGIDAPEFFTHAAGQVIRIHGPVGMEADDMTIDYVTHRETANAADNPTPNHSGLYRNPLPLRNGNVLVVHTMNTQRDQNIGTDLAPKSRYRFRIKLLRRKGGYWNATRPLTIGIQKTVQYYDPNQLVTYSGELWELDPVEVTPRPVPLSTGMKLPDIEASVFAEEGVAVHHMRNFLSNNGLALVVSRDVTRRDRNDRQQPFNLHVRGTSTQTVAGSGHVYDVSHMQFFQADLLRGLTFGQGNPAPGRRVIAQPMHGLAVTNPREPSFPEGSVEIAEDGSMAALVPARRAMSWQMNDPIGQAVVRERYWVSFQPGEIRTCNVCHGLSSADQTGNTQVPQNKPEALRKLLRHLKNSGTL